MAWDDVRPEDIRIRTDIGAADIDRMVQLHGSLYLREHGYGFAFETYVSAGLYELIRHYDPARSRIWLCEHGRALVGCLGLVDRGRAGQLRYLLVHPNYRRIGLARRLMDLFMTFLDDCGYASAYLWTTHDLTAAARLYRAYGFVLAEEKPSMAFGKPVVEQKYVLNRRLKDVHP